MTYPQLPDAEAALVAFLAAHAGLAALHGGRVGTEVDTELACLQVVSLGGPQPWPWEGEPEFALSSWGPRDGIDAKAKASALDRAVRAAFYELFGTSIGGGRVTGGAVRLAGLWSPGDQTGRARYRSDLSLTVMP